MKELRVVRPLALVVVVAGVLIAGCSGSSAKHGSPNTTVRSTTTSSAPAAGGAGTQASTSAASRSTTTTPGRTSAPAPATTHTFLTLKPPDKR